MDHPATQAWKHELLKTAGIPVPSSVTFAPVNFEEQSLSDGLERAGLKTNEPAFFSWLGVTPYLTHVAFKATLGFIASMPPGSGVVFDFAVPRASRSAAQQLVFDALSARVAKAGEPFQLFFEPESLASELRSMGFQYVEVLGADELNTRYFHPRTDGLRITGGHLMTARL